MTAEQRAEDIEFLAKWAKDYSPMVPVNERYQGLPSCSELRPRYVELARQAKDNREFLRVLFGYFNLMAISGHGYVYSEENLQGLIAEKREAGGKGMTNIPYSQLCEGLYWSRLMEDLFVHPPFRVLQRGAAYVTLDPWKSIPRGSRISHVNGMASHAFAQHVKEATWLQNVAGDTGWICRRLLAIPEAGDFHGWDVDFVLPDGGTLRAIVPANRGQPPPRPTEYLDHTKGNCICVELNDRAGYIRIKAMVHSWRQADEDHIRRFLGASKGRYERLIIDVRGNGGGSTFYVYDTLIRPFLRHPATYRQVSGVRKKFQADMSAAEADRLRGGASTWAWEVKLEPTSAPQGFDPAEWNFYEITREVKPAAPYDFNGRLFVLIDRGSGSATETYADAIKRTGLGTLVGERTAGGLGSYFVAETLRLPASGIVVRLEADLDLNPDGSIQELAGTRPDVEMESGDLPETTAKEQLLRDPLIQKILNGL